MPSTIYSREQRRLMAMLREARIEAGLTQAQLAKTLGSHQSFVSKYETGERRVDLVELRRICKALGVGLVDFVQEFDRSLSRRRTEDR